VLPADLCDQSRGDRSAEGSKQVGALAGPG
jgi:hypothetical protein